MPRNSQKGFAHLFLIVIIGFLGIGLIVYLTRSNTTGLPTGEFMSPAPSPSMISFATPTPTKKPVPSGPAEPTQTPEFIDYTFYCWEYDRNSRPPLPARGDTPLLVGLSGSGGVGEGSSLAGFQWDFEGDGKWDTDGVLGAVAHEYNTGGTFRPRFRVVSVAGAYGPNCVYPFDVVVGEEPEFENTTISVDKTHYEFTVSKSAGGYTFPWYYSSPPNDNSRIYVPAYTVSSKENFTFAGWSNQSEGSEIFPLEYGANLNPGTSFGFHFSIPKYVDSGIYEGSFAVTFTTNNGQTTNTGPTITYKVTITD